MIEGGRGEFELDGGAWAELLVAAPVSLDSIILDFGPRAKPELEVGRGEAGGMLFRPSGRISFNILAARPRARHRMWWTDTIQYLYLFDFRLPDAGPTPIRYQVTGLTVDSGQKE